MPDNSIKISADITFNTKDAERQLSSLGDTVSKSMTASKQVREMADSFERISTRDMSKNASRLVDKIREGSKETRKYEEQIVGLTTEAERLKSVARSGKLNPIENDAMQMSEGYKKLISDAKYYQEEMQKVQDTLARGTKTVAGSKEGLAFGESPKAVTRALNPQEIAEAEQYLASLQSKIQGVETEMQNMEMRGDAFPKLTQSIEMTTVALNKTVAKVVNLLTSFTDIQATAPQAMNATESSLNGVYDAMSKLGEASFAQPIQAQASSIQQSMQTVVQATTEGAQQVQQQVEATKQTIAQPVTTQIIDTTAIQNQLMFLSGQLSLLVTEVTTKMDNVASAVTSGFENANNVVNDKVNEINNNVQSLGQQSASTMGQVGSQVASSMQQSISQLGDRVAHLESVLGQAQSTIGQVGASAKKSSKVAVVAFGSIEGAIRSTFNVAKKLASHVGSKLSSAFNNVQKSVDKAFSGRSLKRGLTTLIKYTFGVRSIYFLFRKLRAAVKEGLQNLVKYEKAVGTSQAVGSVNKAITSLNTSLLYLKNAWAAAFAPIITAVMPMLTTLINGLASVGNYIARFIGALTGQEVVLNAVKVSAGDYAKSLDNTKKSANGASKAAKKLSDRLASFDDLNILGKDNDNDSGSGSGAGDIASDLPNPADMFKYVKAESSLADMLKDAWASGDFSGIGSMIKDKIIEALNGIDWDEVQQNVVKFAGGVGSFLEGLLGDPTLYETIGRTAGNAFNTITHGVEELLKHTKNIKFGENIGKGINEFLKTSDFETAGKNVNEIITQITDNINDLVNTISSEDVVNAITDFLDGLDIVDIIAKVGNCVLQVAELTIEVIGGLVVKGGEKLGEKWWTEVTEGVNGHIGDIPVQLKPEIDAKKYPVQAILDNWLAQFADFMISPAIKIASDATGLDQIEVLDAVGKKWDEISDVINDFPGEVKALFDTIGEDFLTWFEDRKKEILDFYFILEDHVTDAIANIQQFGTDIGTFIGDRITELQDLGTKIGEFIGGVIEDLTNFGTDISNKWTELKDGIAQGWEDLTSSAEEKWTTIKDGVTTKVADIKSDLETKWSNITSNITSKVTEIKDFAEKTFNTLKENISSVWSSISGTAYAKWQNIQKVLVDAVNSIKNALKTPINGIISIVESMVNKVIGGLNSMFSKLNSLPDFKITNPFNGKEYNMSLNLPTIKNVSIPRLAQGAVIPPNREFMAVLGDQSHGTNVEAPLDTIKQAVAEVMGNNGNAEVVQLLQQLISVVESKNLVIGDKEIAKANARYNNQQRLIRGASF